MSRDPQAALVRALAVHFGPLADVQAQDCPWASATFSGMRHMIWFTVAPDAPIDNVLAGLHDLDLPMPGQFVADIELAERHGLRIGLRALTIAEA